MPLTELDSLDGIHPTNVEALPHISDGLRELLDATQLISSAPPKEDAVDLRKPMLHVRQLHPILHTHQERQTLQLGHPLLRHLHRGICIANFVRDHYPLSSWTEPLQGPIKLLLIKGDALQMVTVCPIVQSNRVCTVPDKCTGRTSR